jgi:hypothetical protein
MSSGQGYRHTQYNTLQVVQYTNPAKNYFEEFMQTDPNLVVHTVILRLYSPGRKWCLTGRSGLGAAGVDTVLVPRSWAGRPVERAGQHWGLAKGGGWRRLTPAELGPGEAEPG